MESILSFYCEISRIKYEARQENQILELLDQDFALEWTVNEFGLDIGKDQ